jgi:hypothetical protein
MKYKEKKVLSMKMVVPVIEDRSGVVLMAVIELTNGYFRVCDVCNEQVQEDGLDIDIIVAPTCKKQALKIGEWYAKYWDYKPLPTTLHKCIVIPPFNIPNTYHGDGSPEDFDWEGA